SPAAFHARPLPGAVDRGGGEGDRNDACGGQGDPLPHHEADRGDAPDDEGETMMCEQAELRMAELLAGEISSAERAALERHLLDCESCRGDFELARAGTRIEWADVPVPKELIEATLASFREPPAAVRLLRWATAAAAVFGAAVLLMTSSRAPRNAPVAAAPPRAERREVLATMQDAVVGALVCKDEDGRPVGELGLKSHDVTVEILDGIAKTTVEENFENHTDRRLEGTFTFPLPSDA